jgi:hypothetical protein
MTDKEKHLEEIDMHRFMQKVIERVEGEKSLIEEEDVLVNRLNRMTDIIRLRQTIPSYLLSQSSII